MLISAIFIVALIVSAIFHEYAHGWVAHKLGDNTAKDAGRLTLNPLAHLDPVGSILLPILLIISKAGFVLGWAKPVPYNPHNLTDQKYGDFKVALGGPGTNFLLAIFFGLLARFMPLAVGQKQVFAVALLQGNNDFLLSQIGGQVVASVFVLALIMCFINLLLMVFNLIPVPPLDGSKIFLVLLSERLKEKYYRLEPYGFFIILFLLFFGFFNLIFPLVIFLFSLLTGL